MAIKLQNNFKALIALHVVVSCLLFTACSTTPSLSKKQNLNKQPVKQAFNQTDYVGSITERDDIEEACELVSLVFSRAQTMVLGSGNNICLVIGNEGNESYIAIYELLDRKIVPVKLGDKIEEYVLPNTVQFTTEKGYFYYDQTRRSDFDEPDVRLRLLDDVPTADIVVVRKNSNSKRRGLIDIVKNSRHIQTYCTEE